MYFHIKDQALERTLEEIADAYEELQPGEWAAFQAILNERSKCLINKSGMSGDGTMLDYCHLPAGLYGFIKQQMRKRHGIDDFFKTKSNYSLLCKVWTACETRRKKKQILQIKDGSLV